MNSSLDKYCPFSLAEEAHRRPCDDVCPLYCKQGCAFQRIPTALTNLELEDREIRGEITKLQDEIANLGSALDSIAEGGRYAGTRDRF